MEYFNNVVQKITWRYAVFTRSMRKFSIHALIYFQKNCCSSQKEDFTCLPTKTLSTFSMANLHCTAQKAYIYLEGNED